MERSAPTKININFFLKDTIVITFVIVFYSPSYLSQETAKGPIGFWVKLPPPHLSTTQVSHWRRLHTGWRLHTFPLIAERKAWKLWIPFFYSLWFDPTGNRTLVYRSNSRCSIHLTTKTHCQFRNWFWSLQPYVVNLMFYQLSYRRRLTTLNLSQWREAKCDTNISLSHSNDCRDFHGEISYSTRMKEQFC